MYSPRYIERIVVDRNAGEIRLYEAPPMVEGDPGIAPAPIIFPLSFVEEDSLAAHMSGRGSATVALRLLAVDGVEIVPSAVTE